MLSLIQFLINIFRPLSSTERLAEESSSDEPLAQRDWIVLLRSEIAEQMSIFVPVMSLCVTLGIAILVLQYELKWPMSTFILALVIVVWLAVALNQMLLPYAKIKRRRNLIDSIIHLDEKTFMNIRKEYCSMRQEDEKDKPTMSKCIKYVAFLFFLIFIVFVSIVVSESIVDESDTPAIPNPNTARYHFQVAPDMEYYSNNYIIQEGAVVLNGWYDKSGKYHDVSLIIQDKTVEINDRKTLNNTEE